MVLTVGVGGSQLAAKGVVMGFSSAVMAGLVPVIHAVRWPRFPLTGLQTKLPELSQGVELLPSSLQRRRAVDGRGKPGDDDLCEGRGSGAAI
jgi:hypothetical protein